MEIKQVLLTVDPVIHSKFKEMCKISGVTLGNKLSSICQNGMVNFLKECEQTFAEKHEAEKEKLKKSFNLVMHHSKKELLEMGYTYGDIQSFDDDADKYTKAMQ